MEEATGVSSSNSGPGHDGLDPGEFCKCGNCTRKKTVEESVCCQSLKGCILNDGRKLVLSF